MHTRPIDVRDNCSDDSRAVAEHRFTGFDASYRGRETVHRRVLHFRVGIVAFNVYGNVMTYVQ